MVKNNKVFFPPSLPIQKLTKTKKFPVLIRTHQGREQFSDSQRENSPTALPLTRRPSLLTEPLQMSVMAAFERWSHCLSREIPPSPGGCPTTEERLPHQVAFSVFLSPLLLMHCYLFSPFLILTPHYANHKGRQWCCWWKWFCWCWWHFGRQQTQGNTPSPSNMSK